MKRVTDKFALKAFVLSTVAVIGLQAIAFVATAPGCACSETGTRAGRR
ncbi:hypothetical protein ALO43_200459 [Pseudomonas tremae]|uniref:Major facilitator transporter n=1 Tax=Pseudomonas tremae TaxID=200454 RepID=A0AA40P4Q6_9PSED|nr:hypothetical protein ALO43_200459 [Pseudomonas tremae]RMO06264.1 hypothetical protein ALQ48_01788 [Pseudomonas coronafaciens pv. zizaniae]